MSTLRRARSVGVVFAAIGIFLAALAACGGDDNDQNIVQPGAPGEPSKTLSEDEAEALETPTYNPADVRFMQGMIHHHAQALAMTSLAPKNGAGRDVRLIAKRIALSQKPEIDVMRRWLLARDQQAPVLHAAHVHAHGILSGQLMPGMLTKRQLTRLRGAHGKPFDRLFLRDMILHHEGALVMVRRLYAQGGGLQSASDAFARHVEADQEIEIARMNEVLAKFQAAA